MGSFASFADFISMGGYAVYVWSAYAFFALVLLVNIWQPLMARKKYFRQQLKREQVQAERARAQQEHEEMRNGNAT
ncbi:MAG: heme exporter protein CcmD [Gammaproteobacteria bacterium]|nr:heme exporter protein CcmD [Gammaproteobacteria bacterium]MAY02771.1 heme exporter protein CcmD [Gammaproteobacteria bacterium]|tara:strand:+ start:110 stop:337 length:228 start_codon:yes stop_codon:yes gene_type:complete